MTKKDKKKLHKLDKDVDNVVEESTSKIKRKRKSHVLDASLETPEACNVQSGIEEPRPKKKSKKNSKNKLDQEDVALEPVEPQVSPPPPKKSKREKKKRPAEESLGVVDTDILQQARVNLGLNLIDPVLLRKENDDEEQSSKQKKKKKDKKIQVVSSNEPNEKNRNDRAVEYLRLWQKNKKVWKFNKMMQVQLLHIMYDKSLINDEDFEVLLLYLDGLKGKGRERTMEYAKKVLDKEETEEEAVDASKVDRARQIFQMLA